MDSEQNRSTILDQISQQMHSKKYSISVFLYLSIAFDTTDHKILLQNLEMYGVEILH